MRKKIFFSLLIVIVLGMATLACVNHGIRLTLPSSRASFPTVIVRADSWESHEVGSDTGSHCQINESEVVEVPRLVLFDHHRLTDPVQRTLYIDVSGLQISSSGAIVTLLVETQFEYPELNGSHENCIPVWEATTVIDAADTAHPAESSVTFSHTFTELVNISTDRQIPMPTGYFRYQVIVKDSEDGTTLYEFQKDHAFLIENQCMSEWRAEIVETPKVVMDERNIYFPDTSSFQNEIPYNRLAISRVISS